jgi:hypothetical protein
MSSKASRKQRRAKRGDSRGGSQNPRVRDAEKKILQEAGGTNQEKNCDSPAGVRARVVEAARFVDAEDWRARAAFIKTLKASDGTFERKVTGELLAEVWGKKSSTIRRDIAYAWGQIRDGADDNDRAMWWQSMYLELEALDEEESRIEDDERFVDECINNMRVPEGANKGKLFVDAIGAKMLSDARGRVRDSRSKNRAERSKLLESLGKAAGITNREEKVITLKSADGSKLRAQGASVVELGEKLLAFVALLDERHPGVRAEFLAFVGLEIPDVVEAPALPAGGP